MYDYRFQRRMNDRLEAKKRARHILGVSENATPKRLKRAWRKECREHHPDKNSGEPDAEQHFKRIQWAYSCLKDDEDCDKLLAGSSGEASEENKLGGNRWKYFLWWRENYF